MADKCDVFLSRVLDPPRYGYSKDGRFYKPDPKELFREFFHRMNVFQNRKNWLPLFSWVAAFSLGIPLFTFLFGYFTWSLFVVGFIYSMILMGSHGTFWLHRYGTHRAFKVRNRFFIFILRNLVIKIIPEEIYVVSHHVHHQFSEKPGDPYNVNGGWFYCFFADAIHQMINSNLSEKEYTQLTKMIGHMNVKVNTYTQYQRWGTLCHPGRTILHYVLNWSFWFGVFFLIGGIPLAVAIFGAASIWAFGVRTFNYEGHGKGKDRRRDGIDFNREDWSVNQMWPGYVAGEWHNNHHLYANGARSGFLPYQLDLPWFFILSLKKVGVVTSYRDYKEDFMKNHYEPYLSAKLVASNV